MFIIFQVVICMMAQLIKGLMINRFCFLNILNFGDGPHGKKWNKFYEAEISDWDENKKISQSFSS